MTTQRLCWFCRQPSSAFIIAPNHRRMCLPCNRKGWPLWKRLRRHLLRAFPIFDPTSAFVHRIRHALGLRLACGCVTKLEHEIRDDAAWSCRPRSY